MVSIGCVGVLTFGEPTGLELPEVEVPGRGRLLPTVGETLGGVTDDITIVGGVMDDSRVRFLPSVLDSTIEAVNVVDVVVIMLVVDKTVVVVVEVFESVLVVTGILPSMLLDRSLLSMELRVSKCSLLQKTDREISTNFNTQF